MLHIVQSNHLETLAAALFDVHAQTRGPDPLQPFTVVVPSPGHAQWLKRELALRQGIAANLDLPLPAAFAWRLLRMLVPDLPESSPYEKDAVTLRLHRLLPALRNEDGFEAIGGYLAQDTDGCKRYQLARRIADVFDQYLVYRRDWIARFENDAQLALDADQVFAREPWQPVLWRALVADVESGDIESADIESGDVESDDMRSGDADSGNPPPSKTAANVQPRHRAALHDVLLQRLASDDNAHQTLPATVHVFGLTSLPPDQLELFGAIAATSDVHLYVWNPCREFWADIVSETTRAAIAVRAHRPGRIDPARYYESGNPLLASMGRLGRDFVDLVNELAESVAGDDEALFVDNTADSVLGHLQQEALDLTLRGAPTGTDAGEDETARRIVEADDDSLRMHVCHGALREVEVLHDALLARFAADRTLTPREVVVMIPDIERYAPLVDAVFGSAPAARALPYSISDRRRSLADPLVTAFFAWIEVARGRFARSALLDLLEVPAVRRRFGVDAPALAEIRGFLDRAGVHWGRDGAHWQSLGIPLEADRVEQPGSWRFGLDRLLLGFALGDGAAPFAGIAPADGVDGGNANLLGTLTAFVGALDAARATFAEQCSFAQWARAIGQLAGDFFAPDADEQAAFDAIARALQRAGDLARETRHDEAVGIAVFVEHLRGVVDIVESSPRYLAGGITFCTLLPMRTLPFRMVCLCGMNELDYPRRLPALDFDLVRHAPPRRGDRSASATDRHLFLEALLAARDALHVSWVGRSDVDDTPRPPSCLVAELRDYLDRVFAGTNGSVLAQLTVTHRLQPFAAAYFGDDARLFTFDERWLPAPARVHADESPPALLPPPPDVIPVAALRDFLRNPSRVFLEDVLQARIARDSDADADAEAFSAQGLLMWKLKDVGVAAFLAEHDLARFNTRVRLEGVLPHGVRGAQVLAAAGDAIRQFAAVAGDDWLAVVQAREIHIEVGPTHVIGQVPDVRADGGYQKVRVGRANARDLAEFWLYHVLLSAAGAGGESRLVDENQRWLLPPLPDDVAKTWLQALIGRFIAHRQSPVPLLTKTAQALMAGENVREAWEGKSRDSGFGECADVYVAAIWHTRELPQGFEAEAELAYGLFYQVLRKEPHATA